MILRASELPKVDRFEAFREFARRRAAGEPLAPPFVLPDPERRRHIRQTLLEDHQFRIHNRPEGTQAKFEKLAGSAFTFFRGTALLFYRDYCGLDAELPSVFTVGDVHPENFGVMPNEHGEPFFAVNDFDEAYWAPFSWDLRRGAVAFWLACQGLDYKSKHCRKAVEAFIEGYFDGLEEFARGDRERTHQFRLDNSPKLVRELLEDAKSSRRRFLAKMIDWEKERFDSTKEIVPMSGRVQEFQEIVGRYRETIDARLDDAERFFRVKDVAIKKDSGTASLGLDRYFVLLDGRGDKPDDDVVLELKQTRRSALQGLVHGEASSEAPHSAERIANAHNVHVAGGDPLYGHVEIEGLSFLVRERSPYKEEIDLEDLGKKELRAYASICGKTLAQTHARSDEDGSIDRENEAEAAILSSVNVTAFIADMVETAEAGAERVERDFRLFCEDHARGAYRFLMPL